MSKKMAIEMYSDARIAFQRELKHHPLLESKVLLTCMENGELSEGLVIGTVAAEFNIVMDGVYSREQLEDLYDHLFHKMRDSRKEVIISGGTKRIDKVVLDSVPIDKLGKSPKELH